MQNSFRPSGVWRTDQIHMRDAFVYTCQKDNKYYLFGTTFADGQGNIEPQFEVYISEDLNIWEGPYCAFHPSKGFWGVRHYWAPEVFRINNSYYMFATFKGGIGESRGTGILKSSHPAGPYEPISNGPATPPEWECLDGTWYQDDNGRNWIIFCHEWTTEYEGRIAAQQLSEDLTERIGQPFEILKSSEMPWVEKFTDPRIHKEGYLTDAPFMYKTSGGQLLMLWSSYSKSNDSESGLGIGYTVAIARSISGNIQGPWTHDDKLLMNINAGHPSLFKDLNGQLFICTHHPDTPHGNERPLFIKLEEHDDQLNLLEFPQPI